MNFWNAGAISKHRSLTYLFLAMLLASMLASCQASTVPIAASSTASPAAVQARPNDLPAATAARFELRPSSTPQPPATLPSIANQPNGGYGSGYGPSNFPEGVNPLTGLIVEDPTRLERRPMVIKITNFPRSVRPQWGLNAADHVFEYYLEDELTRFIGVFYGKDAGRVGPIRSARPFDENIVRAYKGIFAFAYADDRVIERWLKTDLTPFLVIERPDNCPPMCRIGPESEYNTLYTDTAQLSQYITDKGTSNDRQRLEGLRFEEKSLITAGGGPASRVEIRFSPMSYHYWEYDPAATRYLRWQDAERAPAGEEVYTPLVDSLDNQQVGADNLVILYAPVDYFFISHSTEIYDIQLIGRGDGYALRDGRIFAIQWKRKNPQDMITLTFPNGEPYPLKPGNTWFEVLSDGAPHEVDSPTWRFEYVLPPTPTPTPRR
jgi:hypothetical protein